MTDEERLAELDRIFDEEGVLASVEDWAFVLDGLARSGLIKKGADGRYRTTELGLAINSVPSLTRH